ncbi:MAG TPA: hypothetical protein VM677_15830 [Actinokineospora sp.]|nr:hypothetical protein [Actinokineospora sp.]
MTTPTLLVLGRAEVEACLDWESLMRSQRAALIAVSDGTAVLPARLLVPGADDQVAFCYAARLSPESPAVSKFGCVSPRNLTVGLPTISAVVTVLDDTTGFPRALLDGSAITEQRTAAASAVAIATLLPGVGPRTEVVVIGAGVQAAAHIRVLHEALGVRRFSVGGASAEEAEAFVERHGSALPDVTITPLRSRDETARATRAATLVITCTSSRTPVIENEWISDDTLVVSLGSFAPDRCEVPTALVGRAVTVVDSRPDALTDAGCVVGAVAEGLLTESDITEIGDLLRGVAALPIGGPILYNTIGVGTQDAAAALSVLEVAATRGIGRSIAL